MLRSSEIKPLFVDLSQCDKSFFIDDFVGDRISYTFAFFIDDFVGGRISCTFCIFQKMIRYDTIRFFSFFFLRFFFFDFFFDFDFDFFFFFNFLLLLFFVVEILSCFGFLRSLWYHFSDSLRACSLYILWHKESEFFWIFSSTAYHYMDVQGVASMVHADCISYQPHLPKMP